MRKDNMLTIIVPCYNEEEVLPETVKELGVVLESMISEEQYLQTASCCLSMMAAKTRRGN